MAGIFSDDIIKLTKKEKKKGKVTSTKVKKSNQIKVRKANRIYRDEYVHVKINLLFMTLGRSTTKTTSEYFSAQSSTHCYDS